MPRITRIDRADAFRAIEAIVRRGEAPTHVNVRSELGQRGSPPVISNFISSWFAVYGPLLAGNQEAAINEQMPATAAMTNVPSDTSVIAALTAAALAQIQQAAANSEAEHAKRLEENEQALAARAAELDAREKELMAQQRAHAEHIEKAYRDRDTALSERDLALADASSLRMSVSNLKSQLGSAEQISTLIERLELRIDQTVSRLK